MDIDQLKGAWQARELPAGGGAAAGESTNLRDLVARLEVLERKISRRDLGEYAAACAVMAIFGWMAAGANELHVRLGALMVIAGSMFIIVWSRRAAAAGRGRFTSDLPVARFCARELDRLDAQIRLMKSVWWWYLAPTIVGVGLILVPRAGSPLRQVLTTLLLLVVAAVIQWANAWTARHELEPLRDQLAARLQEF